MTNTQHKIFKISTTRLKDNNWDLTLSREKAFELDEIIALFDSQTFRLIEKILDKKLGLDCFDIMCSIVVDKKTDFKRLTSQQGIKINGNVFKRFVGTTGGLKANTLLFVREDILIELNKRCECGRNNKIKLVPAKYESYKALTSSASVEILSPNKILVVNDCLIKYRDDITQIDDTESDIPVLKELKNVELENNNSDGYNLCTIEYMKKIAEKLKLDYIPSGVCLRNAWLKGMLYPFPIQEFVEKYLSASNNYMIKDIWGNEQDIRQVDMILTESSLKLWGSYSSIDDYVENYKKNGYEFAVTKVSPKELEDVRTLNYQYLQSYQMSDDDIIELCKPTVEWLKNSLCGDYESTLKFLGIDDNTKNNDFTQALYLDKRFLNDPYVIDRIKRLIAKKIDEAKVGKLLCNGNYQILSGDPFALMQHICGLEVTGLLNKNEVYSQYWVDKNVTEVVAFRSPMTNHQNIRKVKINYSDECKYWYQYMKNIFIINGFDNFCMATNGSDFD